MNILVEGWKGTPRHPMIRCYDTKKGYYWSDLASLADRLKVSSRRVWREAKLAETEGSSTMAKVRRDLDAQSFALACVNLLCEGYKAHHEVGTEIVTDDPVRYDFDDVAPLFLTIEGEPGEIRKVINDRFPEWKETGNVPRVGTFLDVCFGNRKETAQVKAQSAPSKGDVTTLRVVLK